MISKLTTIDKRTNRKMKRETETEAETETETETVQGKKGRESLRKKLPYCYHVVKALTSAKYILDKSC